MRTHAFDSTPTRCIISNPEVALIRPHPALGRGHALVESYRLAAVLHVSCELTGVEIIPAQVAFTYPEPPTTTALSATRPVRRTSRWCNG